METFTIHGGRPLRGEVAVRGSKNAATKMMIASLLTDEPCVIENIPFSADTDITRELCEKIGSTVSFDDAHTCHIRTAAVKTSQVPELSRKNRIPILALGPLMHRKGFAEVPVLGGCPIGHRPINFHIDALNKMGATVRRREGSYYAEAHALYGADIELPYPSVGATENILLTAVRARGTTVVHNAAIEPEILNLVEMLREMGGEISLSEETRHLEIRGVERLRGVTARVIPDRNEIVSFAVAALGTQGDIFVAGAHAGHLTTFLRALTEIGASYEITSAGIRFFGTKPYRASHIETGPHPAFMTDWQQPFCVLLTQSSGVSTLHETVYEDRLAYIKDLQRMGADMSVSDECVSSSSCRFQNQTFNHSVRIHGPTILKGAEITMTDLRAGMAHIVAALIAEGESVISGIGHVDRGYEKIDERLRSLGADIERVER